MVPPSPHYRPLPRKVTPTVIQSMSALPAKRSHALKVPGLIISKTTYYGKKIKNIRKLSSQLTWSSLQPWSPQYWSDTVLILKINPAAMAARTEKYRYMFASSGVSFSLGPLLGPAPANILSVLSSDSSAPPPPILMNTTQSMMKAVPIQSLRVSFYP